MIFERCLVFDRAPFLLFEVTMHEETKKSPNQTDPGFSIYKHTQTILKLFQALYKEPCISLSDNYLHPHHQQIFPF